MQFSLAPRQTSQPLAVAAGSIVTVTPATGATALVEYTSGTADQVANGTATWAAWANGTVSAAARDKCATAVFARVTSSGGQVTVDVHLISETQRISGFSTDDADNVTGLLSPNGKVTALGTIRAKSSLSVLGDSIMAYGAQPLPTSLSSGASGGIFSNSFVGWFNELMSVDGTGFDVLAFYAVGGKDLAQIITEQLPLAVNDGTDCAWVHGGVNSLNSTLGNHTIAAIVGYYRTIITALAGAKKLVIIDSVNPVLQTGATNARQRAGEFQLVNAAIQKICAEFTNAIYNDIYSAVVDPASAVLNPLTNYVRSDDGIHNQSIGARAGGYASFKNFGYRIKLTKYKTAGNNLLPAFTGTGGTVTLGTGSVPSGTPPVGWNVQIASGTAAVTISNPGLAPDTLRLSIVNSGGAASTVYLQIVSSIHSQLAAGDTVQASFGYQCTGNVLLNRVALTTRYNGGTSVVGMGQDSINEPTITYPQGSGGGLRQTPPYVLPSNPSQTEFIIGINVGATTGATTIDIRAPSFNKLT